MYSSPVKYQKLLTLVLAGLGIALLGYFAARPSPAPLPPISLLSPSQIPPQRTPLFARIVPATSAWGGAWRLREKVVGPIKPLTFDAAVLRLGALSGTNFSSLAAPDLVGPDGLQVWRLGAAELEALRRQLKQAPDTEVLFRPRLTTGDGCGASMFTGGSVPIHGSRADVGLFLDLRPTLHGEVTDLIASVLWREAVTNHTSKPGGLPTTELISLQTNLYVAARLQLSNASGVFLLRPAPRAGDIRGVGLILSEAPLPTKRSGR